MKSASSVVVGSVVLLILALAGHSVSAPVATQASHAIPTSIREVSAVGARKAMSLLPPGLNFAPAQGPLVGAKKTITNPASEYIVPPEYGVDIQPSGVVAADFNGDGKPDLATSNFCGEDLGCSSPGTVSILLNNGDGTFQPAVNYAVDHGPSFIATGDFNGDGKVDLVVTNACGTLDKSCVGNAGQQGTISILLGNGDGTFQPQLSYAAGLQPWSVAVGDFNGDHKPDLVVANYLFDELQYGTVAVFLGNGDGTFKSPLDYNTGSGPDSVAVADFNSDGRVDIVTTNNGAARFGGNTISVLLGNGDGTFQPHHEFPVDLYPMSVATGDFNGDGKPDIATYNFDYNGTVSVLLGNGDGTFKPQTDYLLEPSGGTYNAVHVADLNHDGKVDLLVSRGGDNSIDILFGNGDGTFQEPFAAYTTDINSSSGAVADLNGDGNLDVVVTVGAYSAPGQVAVLLGLGKGNFLAQERYEVNYNMENTEGFPSSVAVGDFNGDGKQDLVTTNSGIGTGTTVSVFLGSGNGTFGAHQDYSTGGFAPVSVAAGDFNRDGKLDLAVVNSACTSFPVACSEIGTVGVMFGNGDGTFGQPSIYSADWDAVSIATGDLNGDGILDLVVANFCGVTFCHNNEGTISVLLGNKDGTFQQQAIYLVSAEPNSVALGDFNGDGRLDVAVANFGSNTVGILLGNGDGTLQPQVTYPVGNSPNAVAVGDFNGDHILDLAVRSSLSSVDILLGNGNGTFQPYTSYAAGGDQSLIAADLNGDGKIDIVATDNSSYVYVLWGNGDGTLQPYVRYPASTPAGIAAGVFTQDTGQGLSDLAITNYGSNTVTVMLNTAGTLVKLASQPNPSAVGQTVTFKARVMGSLIGSPVPTGTVAFETGNRMGTANLVNGVATFTGKFNRAGTFNVKAVYSGDNNFNAKTSAPISQVVNP